MNRDELMTQLESLLEMKKGTLQGSEDLSTLPGWDSLTQTNFVFLAERSLRIRLSVGQFAHCRTANDLMSVLEAKRRPA